MSAPIDRLNLTEFSPETFLQFWQLFQINFTVSQKTGQSFKPISRAGYAQNWATKVEEISEPNIIRNSKIRMRTSRLLSREKCLDEESEIGLS